MRNSWQVFHYRSLLLRSFWSFVLPVLEYCSAVWCSSADSHLKLLNRVVRSAGFLAGCVLECNLVYRRSVAELCMLFKIKSNPMPPLSGTLPVLYVPARVTRGALVALGTRSCSHVVGLLSIAEPLCPSWCLFGMILVTLCLMVWDWRFQEQSQCFPVCMISSFLSSTVLSFSSFHGLVVWGWVFGLIECSHSLPALHSGLQLIIIIISFFLFPCARVWENTRA